MLHIFFTMVNYNIYCKQFTERGNGMKKTFAKRIYAACCALLMAAALSGCGEESADASADTEISVSESTESASETTRGENEEPPEKPDGNPPDMQDGEEPPQMQDGGERPEKPGGEPPQMQDGENPPEKPDGNPPDMPGGGFGGSGEVTNGTSANTVDSDTEISDEKYTSSGDDENALRIDGANVTLKGVTAEKNGGTSSNTENGDFYGQNAAVLALNGANVTVRDGSVTTNAVNGNGIFSYGSGTVVNIYGTVIRTSERNSGGIQTTGGGTTNAYDLDIETQGASSAAIRSDRGGGEVNVDGGTYVTNGTGSPAVYSTADIEVENAVLTANASEAIVVEGKNSVSLENCTLTGNMSGTYNDSSENIHNIMIYQSMSGDADVGTAEFSAEGGSITALAGDMFYVTNTSCEIELENVAFTLAEGAFLRVEGNNSSRGWGKQGENGGMVTLEAENQKIEGNIYVDEISSLDMTLSERSEFTGAVNPDGAAGNVRVVLEEASVWTLTADSYVTSFDGDLSNVTANGFHLYVNGEAVI